jgi:RNA recognition motif-containing protein
MSRIYLGNLPMSADEASLRQFLVERGRNATKVDLKKKAATGKSRGFAFVDFESEEEAASAIRDLHGVTFDGRELRAADAKALVVVSRDDEDDMPMERRGRRGGRRRHLSPRVSAAPSRAGATRRGKGAGPNGARVALLSAQLVRGRAGDGPTATRSIQIS